MHFFTRHSHSFLKHAFKYAYIVCLSAHCTWTCLLL